MKTLFDQIKALPAGIAAGGFQVVGLIDKDETLRVVHNYFATGGWSTDLPLPGPRRVSIRPELRESPGGSLFPAVVDCEVYPAEDGIGMTVQYRPGGDRLPIDQDWFHGAMWSDRETPQDPFLKLVSVTKFPYGVVQK